MRSQVRQAGRCLLAATLLPIAAACAGQPSSGARTPAGGHTRTAQPGPSGRSRTAASLGTLAAGYLAIARPANRRLDIEVGSYLKYAHRNLRAAEAQLRAEAATERWFDRRLLRMPFPAAIDATAHALVAANNLRIALTERQARATSIASLLAFTGQHKAADARVEVQVRIIRSELGLPPPSTS